MRTSIIIPAYQEENHIGQTLDTLTRHTRLRQTEIIVVDDGSTDRTADICTSRRVRVIRLPQNRGKAAAVLAGVDKARGEFLVMLDADLGDSARHWPALLRPIEQKKADMTMAVLPHTGHGGLGLVRRLAAWLIERKTGVCLQAPLSGQRAMRKSTFMRAFRGAGGYGLEVALNVDFLERGLRVREIEVPFRHRELGKTWSGFAHRLRQGAAVLGVFLLRRPKTPQSVREAGYR